MVEGVHKMFYFNVNDSIQLRLLETRYAEEIYNLTDNDRAYLREWLPWVDGTKSPEDTKAFIQLTLKGFAENNGFNAAIFYEGKIVGCIGLHWIDWNISKTSIGYWMASDYQGKGIMTKSCKAVIDYIFQELKLNRVEIRVAELNRKSRAIPERLGFTHEGTVRSAERLYDHYVDHMIYGVLKDEWL
jgi:ribosomal-protein-serine acetyltransferase